MPHRWQGACFWFGRLKRIFQPEHWSIFRFNCSTIELFGMILRVGFGITRFTDEPWHRHLRDSNLDGCLGGQCLTGLPAYWWRNGFIGSVSTTLTRGAPSKTKGRVFSESGQVLNSEHRCHRAVVFGQPTGRDEKVAWERSTVPYRARGRRLVCLETLHDV